MNHILRNILAIVAGAVIGAIVNGGIIMISGSIIPPPSGADVTSTEGLQASIHLFEPKHFIMPFLAHALGTFIGAFIGALIAASHKMKFAIAIGGLFLAGGVSMVVSLPAPMWFNVLDLVGAYLPMAYLAAKLALGKG